MKREQLERFAAFNDASRVLIVISRLSSFAWYAGGGVTASKSLVLDDPVCVRHVVAGPYESVALDEMGVRDSGNGCHSGGVKMLRRVMKVLRFNQARLLSRKIAGIVGFALVLLDPISGCVCHRPWVVGLRVHAPFHAAVCWHPPMENLSPIVTSGH